MTFAMLGIEFEDESAEDTFIGYAVSAGLTVSEDVALLDTGVEALSVAEAVNVVEQLVVSAVLAVKTIVLVPSAERVFEAAESVPQRLLLVV